MADARFVVRQVGPQVSVQDGGRRGSMRFGVPWSGAMDRKAMVVANAALGNDPGAAGIEVSAGGLVLDCIAGAVSVAIAGGGFVVDVSGALHGSWTVQTMRKGDSLALRAGPWGSWTYLVFAGGMVADHWLGSAATHVSSGLGGGKLAIAQEIVVTDTRTSAPRDLTCPVWARPRHQCHVVLGPQDQHFDILPLLSDAFHLTDAYDRMGVRLRGPLLPHKALHIPSEPIVRGSVQVSGDGVATVLLADHQTTGGYPKIATLLSDDVDGFVQLRPHDAVRFKAISAEQAVEMARFRARAFAGYLAAMVR
jgi:5-oxoprolinase (ATP-hydrolysing) subunit C